MTIRPIALLTLTLALVTLPAPAQELTPRSYWPAPRGTQIVIAAYAYSTGDVLLDPSLPVTGVDSRLNTTILGYFHTVKVAGRTANIVLELPYSWGTTAGQLEGVPARRDLSGIGDAAATFSVNVLGAPSMTPERFQALRTDPVPILGISVKVQAPTGTYDPARLINIGTNRWGIKAELGSIVPLARRWLLELELGTWFFGDNDEFLGSTREQRPILAFETHLVYRFRPGLWAALDLNYYDGGQTVIDGVPNADLQRNARIGITFAYPFAKRHVIKAAYSGGVVTESGNDFDTLQVSYVYRIR